MRKISLVLIFLFFIAASCNQQKIGTSKNGQSVNLPAGQYSDGTVILAGQELKIEMPKEPSAMALGLGLRQSISDSEAMLFVLSFYDTHGFWMKNMNFPIDIVWIKDETVVEITSNIAVDLPGTTDSTRQIHKPKTEVNKVLELKAGWAKNHNLKPGDKIEFKLNQ